MKSLLRKLLFYLSIIWFSPLLILFAITDQKDIIISDVHRWQELLGREKRADLIALVSLLQSALSGAENS